MKAVSRRVSAAALALVVLLAATGFAPGPRLSEEEVRERASSVPQLEEYYANPSVETSVGYEDATDAWRVVLTEGASGDPIAYLTVADDSGEVEGVNVLSVADNLSYPSLTEEEAVKLALADERVQAELSEHGPYSTGTEYEDGEWTVRFYVEEEGSVGGRPTDKGKEVAVAGVDDQTWDVEYAWTGDQVGWQMARGEEGAYGKQANYWYVWGPLALAFALAFMRADRLLSLRNLDVLALLGFLVSHGFFREGGVYEAVLLWYPPLIYLFFRTLLMGFGIGERVERTSNLPTWLLLGLAGLAGGLVLGLNLDSRVIDVGYAGVVGADLILDGAIPYGNMPADVGTGDTYGPLNYLLYVPFVLLFGFSGQWDFLPAAHALTFLAFVTGALALFVAGWRLSGPKVAAALTFAWAAFPYTLYAANNNTNDIVVAAVASIGLAAATSPLGRGASVVAGFAVKLYPIILAPLWMMHDGVRRRPVVDFVLGGVGVFLLTFWVLLIDGRPLEAAGLFYERTIAFQGTRESPWTIFGQVPEIGFLQQPLLAAVIVLAFVVAAWPRRRTVRRLAAFSAALVIGFQLTVNYWFYPYVTWFEPFVFLALLAATNEKTALDGGEETEAENRHEAEGA
ncbi:MAG TPA: glycosyltransferase family 87 protein [Rubrobacteraceae bacterium]|nr:glycosyltransferase family 87 protein [Rubrobacteraceae bacterium]